MKSPGGVQRARRRLANLTPGELSAELPVEIESAPPYVVGDDIPGELSAELSLEIVCGLPFFRLTKERLGCAELHEVSDR